MPARPKPRTPFSDSHPLRHTTASVMLAIACDASDRSMTELGLAMGYNNRSSLSHMASGMAPIPVGSAERIARAVGLDEGVFILATLHQRHPEAADLLLASHRPGETPPLLPGPLLERMRDRLLAGDTSFADAAMPIVSRPLPWDGVAEALASL